MERNAGHRRKARVFRAFVGKAHFLVHLGTERRVEMRGKEKEKKGKRQRNIEKKE